MTPGAKKALIVLLVIVGLVILIPVGGVIVVTALAVNTVGQLSDSRIKQAKTDLHAIENCLDLYKTDKGRYPSTEEGLEAVIEAGKCKAGLRDPWGHEYAYRFPGLVHPDSFDIVSYGADGQPGGEGENTDLVNQ